MNDSSPSKVTISGLSSTGDFNGIQGSVINGTHSIGNVTEDTYTITLSGDPATSTGVAGLLLLLQHKIVLRSYTTSNRLINFPDTTSVHSVKTTSTQSIHGSETAYSKDTTFTNVIANDNYYFTSAKAILSGINETTYLSSAKSFDYQIKMITANANLYYRFK